MKRHLYYLGRDGRGIRTLRYQRRGARDSVPPVRRALVVTVLLVVGLASTWDSARAGEEQPYSVAMHVHGSFCEGIGRIESHTIEASEANVDVIWWTDHDWRMTYYHHVSRYSFDEPREPIGRNEAWIPNRTTEANSQKGIAPGVRNLDSLTFQFTDDEVFEGSGSLRVSGKGSGQSFEMGTARLVANRVRWIRSLASDVTLQVAVYPEQIGPDARASIFVTLSLHSAFGQHPMEQLELHYFLGNGDAEPFLEGNTYHVPIAFSPDQWNVLNLPVTQDAIAGFPGIDGEDNSLHRIQLGVEARNGAVASALFDDFHVDHRIEGNELLGEQRRLFDSVSKRLPDVEQLQGTEISYEPNAQHLNRVLAHLNEFSPTLELQDYDLIAQLSGYIGALGRITDVPAYQTFAARYVIDQAHARGGVVSYNHMFGTAGPNEQNPGSLEKEELAAALLSNRVYGADLLEVGYRRRGGHTLSDHLWVWDELARQQLFLVGTGVSDFHGGPPGHWLTAPNNFVSWVYAGSPSEVDLIAGLKGGRVYFGDIAQFDGLLDMSTERDFMMGQIVLTDRDEADVTIEIDGLAVGDTVRLVDSREVVVTIPVEQTRVEFTRALELGPEVVTFARVEVVDAVGREKLFSNPIYFTRALPEEGVRAERAGLDLGGIRSQSMASFVLTGASLMELAGERGLEIEGRGDSGTIVLDFGPRPLPAQVDFVGMSGSWSVDGATVVLSRLNGEGRILLR